MTEKKQLLAADDTVKSDDTPKRLPKKRNGVYSGILKRVSVVLAVVAVVLLIFGLGMVIGETKAKFSYRWAESYHKNFAGPRGGFLGNWRDFGRDDFISGHGTFGLIVEINGNSLAIKGAGDLERIVLITEETKIFSGKKEIGADGLRVDDKIVVIGPQNDQGQINARLIRLFSSGETNIIPPGPPPKPFMPFF